MWFYASKWENSLYRIIESILNVIIKIVYSVHQMANFAIFIGSFVGLYAKPSCIVTIPILAKVDLNENVFLGNPFENNVVKPPGFSSFKMHKLRKSSNAYG